MQTNYIIIDNEGSNYELVKKMIDNGSSKIAIITTNPHLRTMNMRREGYARALININKGYELACIHGVSAFRVLAPNMNIARMPIEEIGKNAVRILLGDIKYRLENSTEKREVETLVLPCSLP